MCRRAARRVLGVAVTGLRALLRGPQPGLAPRRGPRLAPRAAQPRPGGLRAARARGVACAGGRGREYVHGRRGLQDRAGVSRAGRARVAGGGRGGC